MIERVEQVGIEKLLNRSAYLRIRGDGTKETGVAYLGEHAKSDCGPYLAYYRYDNGAVDSINDDLVRNSCGTGPFDAPEIARITKVYNDMDVRGISVDPDTNVYIRTNQLDVVDLIRTRDPKLAAGLKKVPGHPLWYARPGG